MAPEGRICQSILVIVMDNKLIFENWRKFRHRSNISIHDLTTEEIQAARTLNEMKVPLILALTTDLDLPVAEGRASVSRTNKKSSARDNARRQKELLTFLGIDPDTKVDDLTPEKREEYDDFLSAIKHMQKKKRDAYGEFGIFGKAGQGNLAATEVSKLPFINKIPGVKSLLSKLFGRTDVSVADVINAVGSLAIT